MALAEVESNFYDTHHVEIAPHPAGDGFPAAQSLDAEPNQEIDISDYVDPLDSQINAHDTEDADGETSGYYWAPLSNGHTSFDILLADPHLRPATTSKTKRLQRVHVAPEVSNEWRRRLPDLYWHGNLPPTLGHVYPALGLLTDK